MSEKWSCDFPGCGRCEREHDNWKRVEWLPSVVYLFLAIPIVGNIMALIAFLLGTDYAHLCEEHARQIFKK